MLMNRYCDSKTSFAEEDWLQRQETTQTTQASTEQKLHERKNGKKKKTEWIFPVTNKRNLTREIMDVAKKMKPKREIESLPIAAQNMP